MTFATIPMFDGKTELRFATRPVGCWPAVTGTVVPATAIQTRMHDTRTDEVKSKVGLPLASGGLTAEQAAAKLVMLEADHYARHLKTWNLSGEPTALRLTVLPLEVFQQFDRIVAGSFGLLPDGPDERAASDAPDTPQ